MFLVTGNGRPQHSSTSPDISILNLIPPAVPSANASKASSRKWDPDLNLTVYTAAQAALVADLANRYGSYIVTYSLMESFPKVYCVEWQFAPEHRQQMREWQALPIEGEDDDEDGGDGTDCDDQDHGPIKGISFPMQSPTELAVTQVGDMDRRIRVIALASQKGRAMVLVALPPGKRRDVPSIVNYPLVRAALKQAGANKVGWHQRMSLPDAITLASRVLRRARARDRRRGGSPRRVDARSGLPAINVAGEPCSAEVADWHSS